MALTRAVLGEPPTPLRSLLTQTGMGLASPGIEKECATHEVRTERGDLPDVEVEDQHLYGRGVRPITAHKGAAIQIIAMDDLTHR